MLSVCRSRDFRVPIVTSLNGHTSVKEGHSTGNRQSIRRPRPNSLKLSGFVENSSLIILVVTVFFKVGFRKDTIKIQKLHCCFFCKIKRNFYRNCDGSSTFFTQILKPSTYSDSSLKTASESVRINTIFTTFTRFTRLVCDALERSSVWKIRPESQNYWR